MFITSKLWCSSHRPDCVRGALEVTLKNLGTSYLDLYLIHWPMAYKEGGDLFPKDANDKTIFSSVDYVDTWKELEKAVDDGLVRSIGLSNFNKRQMERVLEASRIKPVTNQIECHPYLGQHKLSAFVQSKGITVTAYSPLGSPHRPWVTNDDPVLLDDPLIIELSKKYNKSPAQLCIRYQIQRGHIVIPKSVTKARIQSNFDVFDFEINVDDVKLIGTLDCNGRICPMDV